MTEKDIRRVLRRRMGSVSWTLVLYYGILNIMVAAVIFEESLVKSFAHFPDIPSQEEIVSSAMGNAWGYLLAILVGLVILMGWKGGRYVTDELWKKKNAMTAEGFLGLLCVFVGGQIVFSLLTQLMDWLLTPLGVDITASLEAATGGADTLSMFLYAGFAAPIAEEILFRGLIQGTLRPYGKRFAIFGSAFLFGMFHGNLVQTPFAFAVGLVLGYTAETYSLFWSIVLHAFNNLVLGDLLTRLAGLIPAPFGDLLTSIILLSFTVAGIVILILHRREVREYFAVEGMDRRCLRGFFVNSGMALFLLLMLTNMMLMLGI